MFDFDTGKLVVIGIVALVVIGPKELPRVLRQVGQTVGKVRRMASEFQSQFMEAMREAELADVKEEMGKIADAAKIDVAFDPVRDIRREIGGAIEGDTTPAARIASGEDAHADRVPSNSVDLAQLEGAASPVAGAFEATPAESGLVGAGIAPAVPAEDDGPFAASPAPGEQKDAGLVAVGIAPQPLPEGSTAPESPRAPAPDPKAPVAAHLA